VTFLRCLAVCAAVAGPCLAEMPDFYKRVNRVTWLVKNLDRPLQGWSTLGLSDVHDYGQITLDAQYRGKGVSIGARVVTGSLGNLTVEMLQPGQGDNAFTDFLTRHGDGIFSIVHEVAAMEEMTKEIERMRGLGVGVLQQMTINAGNSPITLTLGVRRRSGD
jgi:hypothetical protein